MWVGTAALILKYEIDKFKTYGANTLSDVVEYIEELNKGEDNEKNNSV